MLVLVGMLSRTIFEKYPKTKRPVDAVENEKIMRLVPFEKHERLTGLNASRA